jgi:excisionase family DNA binding protein
MTDQELLTASQAAEVLSATSQTIRNWIRSGRLRAVRIGNRFFIPRAEVDRLRRELPAVALGEGVWESAEDAPVVPLPRAGARDSDSDIGERLLGG